SLAAMTLESILTNRHQLSEDILREVKEAAAGYGVAIARADVKDLVFPGNLQEIMNKVLAAERTSQAQLVEARTRAEVQRIDAQTKADAARVQSATDAEAVRVRAEADAAAAGPGGPFFVFRKGSRWSVGRALHSYTRSSRPTDHEAGSCAGRPETLFRLASQSQLVTLMMVTARVSPASKIQEAALRICE